MDLSFKKVFTDFQKYLSDNEFEHDIINKNTAQERNVIKNIMKSNLDITKITTKDETLLDDTIFPNLSLRDLYNKVEDKNNFWKVLQLFTVVKDEEDEDEETEDEKIRLSGMFDNLSEDTIKEAQESVKKHLGGGEGGSNMMTEMLDEIGNELKNKDTRNVQMNEQERKQAELFSSMFNIDQSDMQNIMGIAKSVTNKFKDKIETSDMNPADLLNNAQSLMSNMGGELGGNAAMLNSLLGAAGGSLGGGGSAQSNTVGGRVKRNRKKNPKPSLGL